MIKIALVIILIVLAFLAGFFVRMAITGNVISESYSYTRAICSGNKCIDLLVYCNNGRVTELEPISDLVEFSKIVNESVSSFC